MQGFFASIYFLDRPLPTDPVPIMRILVVGLLTYTIRVGIVLYRYRAIEHPWCVLLAQPVLPLTLATVLLSDRLLPLSLAIYVTGLALMTVAVGWGISDRPEHPPLSH